MKKLNDFVSFKMKRSGEKKGSAGISIGGNTSIGISFDFGNIGSLGLLSPKTYCGPYGPTLACTEATMHCFYANKFAHQRCLAWTQQECSRNTGGGVCR